MSFTPGENVGAYRVVEQLGSGGMATVYKAYHAALDRYVALKVMHPAFKGDRNFLTRFQREARVVAKLEHPNIVLVYDFSEHEGSPYLVMRFIEGETLKARLERGQLTLPEILDVVRPVGEALTYAHKRGVLHRDIKPSNVILAHDGRIFLADFGLARIVQAGESSLTRDAMVGTPYYISPEQAIGKSELDARTDIYSFGVVLYELLTGRVPFKSDTPFAVVHDHIYTPLPLPTSINPNLPQALERVLLKAMAKEPDDRYDSAVELVAAVEDAVTGVAAIPPARPAVTPTPAPIVAPTEAEPVPPQPQVQEPLAEPLPEATPTEQPLPSLQERREGKRRPWLLALGGLAAIAVIAVAAIFLVTGDGEKESKLEAEQPAVEQPGVEQPPEDQLPPPQDVKSYLEKGRELAAQGDIEGALEAYQQAAWQDPHEIATYLEAARLLIGQDNISKAIETLYQGVEANPENPELRLVLAQTLVLAERWEKALPEFEWLIEHEPDMAEPHAYLGVYLTIEVGDLERAQAEIDQALGIDPESPMGHFAQGVYYWKRENLLLARRELRQAQQSPRASPWLKQRVQFFLERFPEEEETFKVGLVTMEGPINDQSFNQSAWEGVQQAKRELDAEIQYIETTDPKDYENNIRQFADKGYDVIVIVGHAQVDVTINTAHEYPDVKFIAVNQFQVETIPNLTGLVFPEDRSGYLAGALAAYLTESNIIGAVLGSDLVPSAVAFKEGYEAGAKAVKPDTKIISTHHPGEIGQTFTDPEWGAVTAAQMINQGADVIFTAAGITGIGALEEVATHEGLYCIGVDTDQWFAVESAHPCLVSSAIKMVTPEVFFLIKMAREEKFPAGNFFGAVGLAPFHGFEDRIPQEVKDDLERIARGLEDGSISTGYGE
jgi:basic membrane protein A